MIADVIDAKQARAEALNQTHVHNSDHASHKGNRQSDQPGVGLLACILCCVSLPNHKSQH